MRACRQERHLKLLTDEIQAHGFGDDVKVVDKAKCIGINFINERRALFMLQQSLQSLLRSTCDSIIHFGKRRRGHSKTSIMHEIFVFLLNSRQRQ